MPTDDLEALFLQLVAAGRNISLLRLFAGWQLAISEQGFATLLFILRGESRLRGARRAIATLRSGACALLPPSQGFRLEPVRGKARGSGWIAATGDPWEQMVVQVDVGDPSEGSPTWAIAAQIEVRLGGARGLFDALEDALILDSPGHARMESIFIRMLEEQQSRAPGYTVVLRSLVVEALIEILRMNLSSLSTMPSWLQWTADEAIARSVAAMRQQLHRAWGLSEWARAAGMSKSHFSEKFSKVVGVPPMAYLRKLRLEAAVQLLETTTLQIPDIAERVGFAGRVAFTHAFRQAYGCAPTMFRKLDQAARAK